MLSRNVHRFSVLFCVLCLTLLITVPVSAQIYVDADATGANDGSSWTDAFTDLQDALAIATSGNDIWVAAGTYKPTQTNDRLATFQLKNGVGLYGGFAGTESSLTERDPSTNATVLSGEIGTILNLDNSYHVVTGSGTDETAVLDGFTISEGYAPGVAFGFDGAGAYIAMGNPTLSNLVIANNEAAGTGGGMYTEGGGPILSNVLFHDNTATSGGGMGNASGSDPVLVNVVFRDNVAMSGAGLVNLSSSGPILTNVTFYGNIGDEGGVMSNSTSIPLITNVIAFGNSTTLGGPHIANIQGGAIISHSLIEGSGGSDQWNSAYGTDAGGNLDADPAFVDAPSGDFKLQLSSPAINTGDNAAPSLPAVDFDGNPRVSGTVVDMGAFEVQLGCPPIGPRVFVDQNATGANNGTSWMDAFVDLSSINPLCYNVTEIWVAAGTYTATNGIDRRATIVVRTNLALYGGFNGTETMLSQRDPVAHPTILSGEIGGPGNGDNSFHVVTISDPGATTRLDGFTITAGNADSVGYNRGGGVFVESGSPVLENLVFIGNSAEYGGGLATSDEVTLAKVTFESNTAYANGGGFAASGNVTLTDGVFESNAAAYNGGGLAGSNDVTLLGVTFQSNTVDTTNAKGGGLYVVPAARVILENVTFDSNGAPGIQGRGGGAFIWSTWLAPVTTVSFVNVQFTNNSSWGSGGGAEIYLETQAQNATLNFLNVRFANNSGRGGGGAALGGNASVSIDSTIFDSNSTPSSPGGGSGGALIVHTDAADVRHTTFVNNYARDGGGISGEANLFKVDFVANEAFYDGGAWVESVTSFQSTSDSCRYDGNVAGRDGGAIKCADFVDSNGIFTNNVAAGNGGAVSGSASLVNAFVEGNHAGGVGGGLYQWRGGVNSIINCVFSGNSAAHGGALFCTDQGEMFVTNSTFNDNAADTSGGAVYTSEVVTQGMITNSILWNNLAPSYPEISAPMIPISYTIVKGSGGSGPGWPDSIGIDGGSNIDTDPLFVDAPNGDLKLQTGSPAVDVGDILAQDLPAYDILGNPRVQGPAPDLGAYEGPVDPVSTAIGQYDLPTATAFRTVYPNPFNPTVTIAFDLDRERYVRVDIYDVKGRHVETVLNGMRPAGSYDILWNVSARGRPLASGVYFVLIRSEGWRAERKIVLLK